jgi:hypothetical protein
VDETLIRPVVHGREVDETRLGPAVRERGAHETRIRPAAREAPTLGRAPRPAALPVEPDLAGPRFEVRRVLGRGGMARVYAAWDTELGCEVALKVLHAHLADETMLGRLRREVVLARRIAHPNVLRLYDVVRLDEQLVLSMELVEGGSLKDWLREAGPPDEAEALRVLREVAAGLDAAHRLGILHRDIKPANVLMTSGRAQARLADFGLAFSLAEAGAAVTLEGVIMGTPAYMAPEVFLGDLYDPRSDLYAFGALAYELLAGRPPFRGASPFELMHRHCHVPPEPLFAMRPELSAGLEAIVSRCLQKAPEARFQSTAELSAAFDALSPPPETAGTGLALLGPAAAAPQEADATGPAKLAASGRSMATSGTRRCAGCGEALPPQLAGCPFCAREPLASLGQGKLAVVLEPPVRLPLRRLVLRTLAFDLPQLHRLEVTGPLLDTVALAAGAPAMSGERRREALRSLGTLPCLLLDRLDEADARELAGRLEPLGVCVTLRRLGRVGRWLARSSRRGAPIRTMASVSLRAAIAVFNFWLVRVFVLGTLDLPGPFVWGGCLGLGTGLVWLRHRRPLSRLDVSGSGATAEASEAACEAARTILPRLRSASIRRIAVSLLSSLAALRSGLPEAEKGRADAWLVTGLRLALSAQTARDERLSGSAHDESGERETHALTRLLRLRAQVDLVLTGRQLDAARLAEQAAELEALAGGLLPEAETGRG